MTVHDTHFFENDEVPMAERTPHREAPGLMSRIMTAGLRGVLRAPFAVVALATALAALAVAYSTMQLGYKTSRHDLVNPKNEYGRLWNEYIKEFGEEDDAVVVVEGESRAAVVPVLQELADGAGRREQAFPCRVARREPGKDSLQGSALSCRPTNCRRSKSFSTKPARSSAANGRGSPSAAWCRRCACGMQHEAQEVHGPRRHVRPRRRSRGGRAVGRAVGRTNNSRGLASSLLSAVDRRRGYQSPWPEMPQSFATLSELNSEYLLTQEGKLGFVLLRLAQSDDDGFARGAAAVEALRTLLEQAAAAASRGEDRPHRHSGHGIRRDGDEPNVDDLGQHALARRRGRCCSSPASAACGTRCWRTSCC